MASHIVIILAAGEGTRMRSQLPKVLHNIAGWPMIRHVVNTAQKLPNSEISVVVGTSAEQVKQNVEKYAPNIKFYEQKNRLGTGHAVLSAREALLNASGVVLILFGDTPLLKLETLQKLSSAIQKGADIAILGFETNEPHGYGRIIIKNENVEGIIEEKDATETQRKISLCNAGAMAIKANITLELLDKIENNNSKNEYYLTDVVKIAHSKGFKVTHVIGKSNEAFGANNRVEMAELERLFQVEKRHEIMMSGVTLTAPETVFFSADTEIATDVIIEPNVIFGENVCIETGSVIHSFCHIEGAHIGAGVNVGPFARLRKGTVLHEHSRVGNFVEVKNTTLETGAKANHLSYLGDAHIGMNANIGAGTITCNYNGFEKFKTHIGAGAFIGSNTALVAPIFIGDEAIIGAGSTLTRDVPSNSIAVARGVLVMKQDAATRFRETKKK